MLIEPFKEYIGYVDPLDLSEHLTDEEIVRCRDCKHGHGVTWPVQLMIPSDYLNCVGPLVEPWDYWNDMPNDNPVPPYGFCAWGERKVVGE